MNYQIFESIFNEIVENFPKKYIRGIHGIFLRKELKHDPSVDSLYRLGEYVREPNGMGNYVVIYYGSFIKVYGFCAVEDMRERILHTLLHEIQHHLEHQSGIDKLGDEDRLFISNYKKKMNILEKKDVKKEIFNILTLIFSIIVFILIILYMTGNIKL